MTDPTRIWFSYADMAWISGPAEGDGVEFVRADLFDALQCEVDRLRIGAARQNEEICQSFGKALGYPWYRDDQQNFPGTTDADGVCVGEHVAETLGAEAAAAIARLKAELEAMQSDFDRIKATDLYVTVNELSVARFELSAAQGEVDRLKAELADARTTALEEAAAVCEGVAAESRHSASLDTSDLGVQYDLGMMDGADMCRDRLRALQVAPTAPSPANPQSDSGEQTRGSTGPLSGSQGLSYEPCPDCYGFYPELETCETCGGTGIAAGHYSGSQTP
jgi:hypothetical protein